MNFLNWHIGGIRIFVTFLPIVKRQGWSIRVQKKVNVAVWWCMLCSANHAGDCIRWRDGKRSVKERIGDHMRDIKNQTEKPIMIHFSGRTVEDVRFVVLQCLGKEGRPYK